MAYIKDVQVGSDVYLIEPALYVAPTLSGSTYSASLANFALVTGATVQAKFASTNPANATLNVNSTGAKDIFYNGAKVTASLFKANHVYTLTYDGTQWQLVGDIDTNTQSNYGNITTGGLLSTASQAVVTDSNKKITTANLSVTDPTAATTTSNTFIDTISQNAQGKITATKKTLPTLTNVSYTVASDANEYPILMKNSTGATTTAAGTKFNSGVTINPSEKTITAGEFKGNLNIKNLTPISTKTYTTALYTSAGANYYQTFISVTPNDYNGIWVVRYKMYITASGHSDYTAVYDASISGRANTYYSYRYYNSLVTYPIYQHMYLRSSSATTPHELGVRIASSYGADSVQKVIKVELLEQDNCTATLMDSLKLYTSATPSGYAGWSGFNATSNGLQEASDANDTGIYIYSNGFKGKAGTNKVYRYCLFARTGDGTYESFVMQGNTRATTKGANPHGFVPDGKIYWNSGGGDYSAGTLNISAYEQYHVIDYLYSFNFDNQYLKDYCETYVVYTYNESDGLLYLDQTQWLAAALPTTVDGKIYQRIGSKYYTGTSNYYQGSLLLDNPYYEYKDGHIRSWVPPTKFIEDTYVKKSGDTMTGDLILNAASGNSPSILFTRNGSLTDWKIVDTAGKLSFQSGTDASTWTERAYFKDNSGNFVATSFSGNGSALTNLDASKISSGTLALARLGTQAVNTVLAGPSSGSTAAAPTFRALVAADVPVATSANYVNLYEARGTTTTLNKAANYVRAGAMFHLIASSSTSATDNGKPPMGDANVLQMNWDHNGGFDAQLAISTSGNRMEFRNQPSSKTAWREVVTITPGTAVGAAKKPVYVDATGVVTGGDELKDLAYISKGTGSTKFLREDGTWQTALTSHQSLTAYAKLASPTFTGTPKSVTPTSTSDGKMIATKEYVDGYLAVADAMVFKGTLGTGGTITAVPTNGYSAGWTYKVITAGTWAGAKCEVGDLLIAITDAASGQTAVNNAHWTVVQTNIDGAVTGPASATNGNIALFDGTTGKIIKNSDYSPSSFAAASHTHNYAGSSSAGGAANSLVNFKVTTSSNLGIDAPGTNAIGYVSGLTKAAWNYQQTDGALYTQFYNTSWIGEIFQDYRTGQLSVRGKNNNTWQTWRRIVDETNGATILGLGTGANNGATLGWGTTYTIAKINGTDIKFTTMAKPTYTYSDVGAAPSSTISCTTANVKTALGTGTGTTKYLREDGTWQAPPDNNTHYTTKLIAGGSTATANAAVTSGNIYLRLFDDSTVRNNIQLKPGNNVTITSDANGVITFNSSYTNTWNANTKSVAGYVAAPGAVANKVWKTDASGNPAWRDDADTDTHYTTHLYVNATAAGAASNAATANTTTYMHLYDDSVKRDTVQFIGSGATTVTATDGKVITITSTNTNNAVTHTVKTATKYYVTGTESATTSTGGDTFDTGVYVTDTAGQLNATTFKVNEQVTLQWSSTTSSLDFVFT